MSELKAIEELQKKLRSAENGWRYWKSRCQVHCVGLEKENKALIKENRQLNRQVMELELKVKQMSHRLVSRGFLDP